MVTTCLNAFVSEAVSSYSHELDHRLRDAGFTGRAYLGQSLGGVLDPEEAAIRPLHLFNSGPVGGVTGARRLAQALGIDEFITGDMGGTSYDVALVRNQSADVTHRAVIDRFETGLSQLDITTVGAGGGSICWIDEREHPGSAHAAPVRAQVRSATGVAARSPRSPISRSSWDLSSRSISWAARCRWRQRPLELRWPRN